MTALSRVCVTLALAAGIAGCSSAPAMAPNTVVTSPRTGLVIPEQVRNAVLTGRSTKSDVAAALGEALVIKFESGYEVWVYRLAHDSRPAGQLGRRGAPAENTKPGMSAEFVILFAPSGLVAKTRFRPAAEGA
jgi:hypothetical protein